MSKELEIIKDGTHLTSCSDKDVAVIDDRWLSWGDWWLGADPAMIYPEISKVRGEGWRIAQGQVKPL